MCVSTWRASYPTRGSHSLANVQLLIASNEEVRLVVHPGGQAVDQSCWLAARSTRRRGQASSASPTDGLVERESVTSLSRGLRTLPVAKSLLVSDGHHPPELHASEPREAMIQLAPRTLQAFVFVCSLKKVIQLQRSSWIT